jgi:hypothetical protein
LRKDSNIKDIEDIQEINDINEVKKIPEGEKGPELIENDLEFMLYPTPELTIELSFLI